MWGWMISFITSLSDTMADTGSRGGGKTKLLDFAMCEAATVPLGASLIICTALTSLGTSAMWREHENMSIRLCEVALLSEKES